MKQRLLKPIEKETLRTEFANNPIYQLVRKSYKSFEREMSSLKFSPEDVFLNCFIQLDTILKQENCPRDYCAQMWEDLYTELRDCAEEENRQYQENELSLAVSCTLYSLAACLDQLNIKNKSFLAYSLIAQIEAAPGQDIHKKVGLPLLENVEDLLNLMNEYLRLYCMEKKYISDQYEQQKRLSEPIKRIMTARQRNQLKYKLHERLAFLKGVGHENVKIMQDSDFNRMIEAVDYLVENNVVKQVESKIAFHIPFGHLRYTFYLCWKEDEQIDRRLWCSFIVETFSGIEADQDTIYKKFSDKPTDYYKD